MPEGKERRNCRGRSPRGPWLPRPTAPSFKSQPVVEMGAASDSTGEIRLGPLVAQRVLPIVIVGYLATSAGLVVNVFLKTFNRSSDLLRWKIALAVVTLATSTGGALLFRSASGVAIGVTATAIVMCSAGLAYYAPWRGAYSYLAHPHSPAGGFDG